MMNITRHKKQINRIIACQTDRQTEDVRMILLRLITANCMVMLIVTKELKILLLTLCHLNGLMA